MNIHTVRSQTVTAAMQEAIISIPSLFRHRERMKYKSFSKIFQDFFDSPHFLRDVRLCAAKYVGDFTLGVAVQQQRQQLNVLLR